jgi:hypothetical protein
MNLLIIYFSPACSYILPVDHVSHLFKTTGEIILYILIFTFVDGRLDLNWTER